MKANGRTFVTEQEKDERRKKVLGSASFSNDLLCDNRIFSGENSRELWEEINKIDNAFTGDDIRDVLYSFGCAMQRLEAKMEKEKGT